MDERPNFIDLPPRPLTSSSRQGHPSPRGLPSPRVEHNAGDIPPDLSPLDAFALQGRLLAKQLDESAKDGKRVSRLPPLTIASSLAHARPGYLRSISSEGSRLASEEPRSTPREDAGPGTKTALETPAVRPKSVHPRLSGMPLPDSHALQQLSTLSVAEQLRDRPASDVSALDSPLFAPKADRPPRPGFTSNRNPYFANRDSTSSQITQQRSFDASGRYDTGSRGVASELAASRVYNGHGLAPPDSPHRRANSSVRSAPMDRSEDDAHGTGMMGASTASLPRKQSSGDNYSSTPPRSPFFPPPPPRSPSVSSEYSTGGTRNIRGNFNFSRPISRAERPSFDTLSRQTSSDSQPYFQGDDVVGTPVSMHSEDNLDGDQHKPVPAYTYSKFSLPRGRMLQRNPGVFQDDQTQEQHHIQFQQPSVPYSNVRPATPGTEEGPTSPVSPPREFTSPRKAPSPEKSRGSPLGVTHSPRPSTEQSVEQVASPRHVAFDAPSRPTTSSATSTSTVKPDKKDRDVAASTEITAEEHLERGIDCHERGSVNESTYHLRIAAKANHPTAMLLYALACRHGWGMRPNPREGVQWLRKAMDLAGNEVAVDEDLMKEGKSTDVTERKTRQAQFALSIYELGVSHMNGWGIEQDKALALRCFEIAGAWGDGDALAEAGFCYAQGVGCKKDLKKAARFYRQAEAKGMSMVGNSWIYKSKYNEDPSSKASDRKSRAVEPAGATSPEKKSRDKSRTRTIFGRRKTVSKPADG